MQSCAQSYSLLQLFTSLLQQIPCAATVLAKFDSRDVHVSFLTNVP